MATPACFLSFSPSVGCLATVGASFQPARFQVFLWHLPANLVGCCLAETASDTPSVRSAMLPQRTIPAADLALLRKFDTPTICNVVELFDIRPRTAGYMDGRIQACYPKLPPLVGFASTATFRSAAPPRAGDVYAGLTDQV